MPLHSIALGARSAGVVRAWRLVGRSGQVSPGNSTRSGPAGATMALRTQSSRSTEFESPSGGGLRRRPPPNLCVVIVPQQSAYIVERLGKFNRTLGPGLHFLLPPPVDVMTYAFSLKEEAISIPNQIAITRDNVTIHIDGVLYVKVEDPKAAAYGVENPYRALTLLAQTTMRSELGKLSLDKTFEERETLNAAIVRSINDAAASWGIRCLRYEIRDINPPANVRKAMELQAEAERRKRATVLDSEGEKQSEINIAEGQRTAVILSSEAEKQECINRAEGEAAAIRAKANATAEALSIVAKTIAQDHAQQAMQLRIAEQYVSAFANLAKESNTLIMPADAGNAGRMVAEAMSVLKTINASPSLPAPPTGSYPGMSLSDEPSRSSKSSKPTEQ
ncbi:Stomatin-like protein 2, mitochondrial [Porphyridium purpureum]|uniref:Stomatin-like protein 2, mitochondrial n=1 Tax=Porphyridium purpureum TaxID=35688 RepID=A0A5J4Z4D4_PORPP|nr:Stomatin-like protein 2, mitochondrial [Porphyridium purpureum]|eukprot:POR2283..scf295_1